MLICQGINQVSLAWLLSANDTALCCTSDILVRILDTICTRSHKKIMPLLKDKLLDWFFKRKMRTLFSNLDLSTLKAKESGKSEARFHGRGSSHLLEILLCSISITSKTLRLNPVKSRHGHLKASRPAFGFEFTATKVPDGLSFLHSKLIHSFIYSKKK